MLWSDLRVSSAPFEDAKQVVERRKQQRRAGNQSPPNQMQRDRRGGRGVDRQVRDDQIRVLRYPPAPQNQRHLRRGAETSQPESSPPQSRNRANSKHSRRDLQWPRPPAL